MSDAASVPAEWRRRALEATREFARARHAPAQFVPGETPVPYAGRVFGPEEVEAAVAASLDFWLTLGPEGGAFEDELAQQLGVRRSLLVNSGSSANLLAVAALTSAKLPAERRLLPGDEVITCAAGFPTTVAPIVQQGAVPVFVDADPATGNPDFSAVESTIRPGKTKAMIFAHALGNPFDLSLALALAQRHNLWLIEDNCDALGSVYQPGDGNGRPTGTWGDLSTQSFYPPHHLTMGEGGAVNIVRHAPLGGIVESFRDWGRDCWCPSGQDNTCGKRFGWQMGELPEGYDHKYIYRHLGYNLKPTDLQAAIGRVQLRRLPEFNVARRAHWQRLRRDLAGAEEFFEFALPTHARGWSSGNFAWDDTGARTDPAWFGFMLLRRADARFTVADFSRFLDRKKVGHRRLFGGNLVRQPAFVQLRRERPDAFRTIGDLAGADRLMNDAIFLGVYPGLTDAMLTYLAETVHEFCAALRRGHTKP